MAIQETSAGSFWWINPKPHQSLSTAESICKQAIERVVSDWTSHKPNGYVPKVMVIHHVIHFHTFPEFWCSRVCGNLHCWRRMPVEGCMHTTCWVFLHSQDKGVWSKLDWSVNHGISLSLSLSLFAFCLLVEQIWPYAIYWDLQTRWWYFPMPISLAESEILDLDNVESTFDDAIIFLS